jgi:Protein of unknown function (DUF2795)
MPQRGEDPARPTFGAEQPTVREEEPRRLEGHPVDAVLAAHPYPATRAELVRAARNDASVDDEVASWLEAVLPPATYRTYDEVRGRVARSGMGPPTSAAPR